jgi:hypothetical protein
LYFAHRGPYVEDLTDREVFRAALEVAYASDPDDPSAGPVDYVDLDRLCDEAVDMRPGQARRFYLNIPDETADESWLPDGLWEELRHPGALLDPERPGLGTVQIRAGFHSGPVVASVVGNKNPRYWSHPTPPRPAGAASSAGV